jgi:hypothetical protein
MAKYVVSFSVRLRQAVSLSRPPLRKARAAVVNDRASDRGAAPKAPLTAASAVLNSSSAESLSGIKVERK